MLTVTRLLPVFFTLMLAGCAGWAPWSTSQPSQPSQPARQPSQSQVNLSGYSATFRQGYNDGCDSARTSMRRDEKRYLGDGDYKMGWNDGHSMCQARRPVGR